MRWDDVKAIATIAIVTLAACLSSDATGAVEAARDPAVFLQDLQSENIGRRIETLKLINRAGLCDESLFDALERQLLAKYVSAVDSDLEVDEVSWLCKALASSGLPKYRPALAEVAEKAPSSRVAGHAEKALSQLSWYAQRNATMASQTEETRGMPPEAARLVNMLRSSDLTLKRDAAKTIARSSPVEPRIYDVAEDELLRGHAAATGEDFVGVDAMCWLCKALASSGNSKYKETLKKVATSGGSWRLQRHAQEGADQLQ